MRVRHLVVLGALLGAAAPSLAQDSRDSAGVRIVENKTQALPRGRAWRVEARPFLQIGRVAGGADPVGQDTVYELLRVMGVARLSDGRIAVANQGSSTIRFFDSAGRFVGSAGRDGEGPAEFRQILGMKAIRGDTLFVVDLGEIEFFSPDGRHLRRGERRLGSTYPFVFPSGVFDDGSYGGLDYDEDRMRRAGSEPFLTPLVHVTENGTRLDTLALVPVSLVPAVVGIAGLAYFWFALALGVSFLVLAVRFAALRSEGRARVLFYGSLLYLPLVWAAMILDH